MPLKCLSGFFLFVFVILSHQKNLKAQSLNYGYRLIEIGTELSNNGRHQLAIDTLERAKVIFKNQKNWEYYSIAFLIQNKNFFQLGEFETFEDSLNRCKSVMETNETLEIVDVIYLFQEGVLLYAKGDYQGSIASLNKAIKSWDENESIQWIETVPLFNKFIDQYKGNYFGHIYNYMGFGFMALGDNDQALDYFRQAKYEYSNSPNPRDTLSTLINIGSIFFYKKEYTKAKEWLAQVEKQMVKDETSLPYLSAIYNYRSIIAYIEEDLKTEERYLTQLDKMFSKPELVPLMQVSGTASELAKLSIKARLLRLKVMEDKSIELPPFEYWLQKIEDLANGQRESLAELYRAIGEVYAFAGDDATALKAFQAGIHTLTISGPKPYLVKNPKVDEIVFKIGAIGLLERKSAALQRLSEKQTSVEQFDLLKESLETTELTLKCAELVRHQIGRNTIGQMSGTISMLSLEEDLDQVFDRYVTLTYQCYLFEKDEQYLAMLLEGVEKSKAFMLRYSLGHVSDFDDALNQQRLKKIRSLEASIFYKEKKIIRLMGVNDKKGEEEERLKLFELKRQLTDCKSVLQSERTGDIGMWGIQHTGVIDHAALKSLSELAPSGSVFIQYYETTDQIYTLLYKGGEFSVFNKKKPKDWGRQVELLNVFYRDKDLVVDPQKIHRFGKLNEYFYLHLLSTPIDRIKDDEVSRLVFVPHKSLHQINFGLLLTEPMQAKFIDLKALGFKVADMSKPAYLLKKYAISYTPSLTLLYDELTKLNVVGRSPGYKLMAFAPSYENRMSLGELPDELGNVLSNYRSGEAVLFKGKKISADFFKEKMDTFSTDILHVSAHGSIHDQFPLLSSIKFAKVNGEDEDLELTELFNMRIRAKLTIISTCKSGEGEVIGGSGRISLGSGFARAGCPSLLVSMWNLDAQPSQFLMENIYLNLSAEKAIDESLRLAQLSYLQNQKEKLENAEKENSFDQDDILFKLHPYYWGGMIPMGVMNAIN